MSGATATVFPHYPLSKLYQTMSEIGTLSLERLNNGAHFLFISNVLARAEADANIKSKLSTQIASLKSAKEQEDEDLKISQKSLLTDDIAAADAGRDGIYSGYKKAVNGFKNLPVENMAQAAKVQGIWSYYKPPHITHIFCNFGVTEG